MRIFTPTLLLKACVLLLSPIFLSGCWGQENLEQLTVVSALGLDAAPNNQIQVTVQLVNPMPPIGAGGGKSQKKPFVTYSAVGDTIVDALNQIQQQAKKKIFLPQTKTIVIGEELARSGIYAQVDFFWRNIDQNLTSWILVSKQTAQSTLQNAKELENVPANAWKLYFQNKRYFLATGASELYKFLPRLTQVGLQATAAGIVPISDSDNESVMKIGDTVIFKDYKLIGWLTSQESQVVNWLNGELDTGTLSIEMPGKGKTVVVTLREIHVRMSPVLQDDRVTMRIRINGKAEVVMAEEKIDVTDLKLSNEMERELNKQIQRSAETTIAKIAKNFNSDIVGFGEVIHRKYPERWKQMKPNWNQYLADMDVQVDASAEIEKSGLQRVSR